MTTITKQGRGLFRFRFRFMWKWTHLHLQKWSLSVVEIASEKVAVGALMLNVTQGNCETTVLYQFTSYTSELL